MPLPLWECCISGLGPEGLQQGKRISSMVMVLSLKSNTAPISCKVCLPMIRLYNSSGPPLEYLKISRHRCTFLFAEYLTKESSTSPTLLVLKVPLQVLHDSGTALLTMGMLLDPFSKKRRSPLDPVSRRTLIVLCLTISLSLVSFGGGLASLRHFLDWFRPNFTI